MKNREKQNIVLAGKHAGITSQNLAAALGYRIVRYGRPIKFPVGICIRYGNRITPVQADLEINSYESVCRTSDKLAMINAFEAYNQNNEDKISFPRRITSGPGFYRNRDNVTRYRENMTSYDVYGLEKIEKVKEYRVHIFNGNVICVMEKRIRKALREEENLYSKLDNCIFKKREKYKPELVRNAKAAIKACGLLFGGVDVIYDGEKFYVLEVNSACGLGEKSIENWVSYLNDYINEHVNNTASV